MSDAKADSNEDEERAEDLFEGRKLETLRKIYMKRTAHRDLHGYADSRIYTWIIPRIHCKDDDIACSE